MFHQKVKDYPYGGVFTPQGTLRALIVFVKFEGFENAKIQKYNITQEEISIFLINIKDEYETNKFAIALATLVALGCMYLVSCEKESMSETNSLCSYSTAQQSSEQIILGNRIPLPIQKNLFCLAHNKFCAFA